MSGTWNPLEMGELSLDLISMMKLDENEWGNGRCKKNYKAIFSELKKRMKEEKWENKNLRVSEGGYYKNLKVYKKNEFTGEEVKVFNISCSGIRDIVGNNKKEVLDKEDVLIRGIIEKVKLLGGQTCVECRGSGYVNIPNDEKEKDGGKERISSGDFIDNMIYKFKLMIDAEWGLSKKKEDKLFTKLNGLRNEYKKNYCGWFEVNKGKDEVNGDNKG